MITEIHDTELFRIRMDAAVWPAERRLRKAVAENRGLTATEDAYAKIAKIELSDIWSEWIETKKKNGEYVTQWEREQSQYGSSKQSEKIRVTNADSNRPQFFLYGDIEDGTAKEFQQSLDSVPDSAPIDLRVFSYGGSFHDSIAIHNLIAERRGAVHGFVDSVACSGASALCMACGKVTMMSGSWMMVHGIQVTLMGSRTADELHNAAEFASKTNRALFNIYRPRWRGTDESLLAALADDTWFDESDSVATGLADEVSSTVSVAAHVDGRCFKYKNTPQSLALSISGHADRIHVRRRLAELIVHRACV